MLMILWALASPEMPSLLLKTICAWEVAVEAVDWTEKRTEDKTASFLCRVEVSRCHSPQNCAC